MQIFHSIAWIPCDQNIDEIFIVSRYLWSITCVHTITLTDRLHAENYQWVLLLHASSGTNALFLLLLLLLGGGGLLNRNFVTCKWHVVFLSSRIAIVLARMCITRNINLTKWEPTEQRQNILYSLYYYCWINRLLTEKSQMPHKAKKKEALSVWAQQAKKKKGFRAFCPEKKK